MALTVEVAPLSEGFCGTARAVVSVLVVREHAEALIRYAERRTHKCGFLSSGERMDGPGRSSGSFL